MPDRVLDEAWLQVGVLDDEQLVRPLEQFVHRRAHRALDDVDEVLGVHRRVGSDEERSAPALVVRRERDELEDALDVATGEAGFEQPVGGGSAHEPLRTRAGIDAPGLDADDAAHPVLRCVRDADQHRDLLRREARHRCSARERVLRFDPDLGTQRRLPVDDVPRDVLRERLDEEGLADHDLVDRLAEDLGEARHMNALLGRVQVDRARDLGGEGLLVAFVPDADRLLDAGDPGPGQPQLDVGQ